MDPDENLAEQLRICHRIAAGEHGESDTDRLAELVLALDTWLRGGGFLPRAWTPRADRELAVRLRTTLKLDRQADSGHESEAHEALRRKLWKLLGER